MEGFGLNGSELRCSPSFVVFHTGELGFLIEAATPVVSHLDDEGRRTSLLRLFYSKEYSGFIADEPEHCFGEIFTTFRCLPGINIHACAQRDSAAD